MFTTIKTYRDVVDANVDKGYLESKGIECHLNNEQMISADWLLSQAVGGVELQVKKESAEEALSLLHHPTD